MKQDNPKQADLFYTAGLFDGEGYVAAYVGGGSYRRSLMYTVSVAMKNVDTLLWLQKVWGGSVYPRSDKAATCEWRLSSTAAYEFLKVMIPYLRLKNGDVKDMIHVWENRLTGDKKELCAWRKQRKANRAAAETKRKDTWREEYRRAR